MKEEMGGILHHTTPFTLRVIMNMVSKKIIVKTTTIISKPCMYNRAIFVCLFVCLFALRPKSTAMVIAGRSIHLTTPFPGQA